MVWYLVALPHTDIDGLIRDGIYLVCALGGVRKLRIQDLSFFDHLPPLRLHFLWYKSLQKVDFLTTYLPPSGLL